MRSLLYMALTVSLCMVSSPVLSGENELSGDKYLDDIHAPKNIRPPASSGKIVIAIVDDGIRTTHNDVQDFIWTNMKEVAGNRVDDDGNSRIDDVHGWDISDGDSTITPPMSRLNEYYHGTHLAGIITTMARRAYGEKAPDLIQIMPVKALSDTAEAMYIIDGYNGIDYAVNAGADIVLASWGVGHISPEEKAVLDVAKKKGVLIVSTAGNFPENRDQYPAAHEGVLAVTSLSIDGKKMDRSNFGGFVDISAPGEKIRSAGPISDSSYRETDGTSPASAMVAAAAAIVKLQHPSYSWDQVKASLKNAAVPIPSDEERYAGSLGAGKLDIEAALGYPLLASGAGYGKKVTHTQGYLHATDMNRNNASWTIELRENIKGLFFHHPVIGGSKGRLTFYEGTSSEGMMVAKHFVSAMPERVYVPGTKAFVTYETGDNRPLPDLLMEYRAEPIQFSTLYCSGTKNLNEEGTLSDGSGPEDYSHNSDCKWLITAPEGKVINIKFTEFDTEARTDLVYMFNGAGTHEKIMAIFSGPDIPPAITTWRNQVLVWFVTNESVSGKGWKAEYRFIEPDKK